MNPSVVNGLAGFASSYIKRFLEPRYDALMKVAPVRALAATGAPTRYGIEAALYALLAYADQKWAPSTPIGKMAREVIMDAPAEFSKRLINGAPTSEEQSQIRAVEEVIDSLSDGDRASLLAWLRQSDAETRAKLRAIVPQLSDEELTREFGVGTEDGSTSPRQQSRFSEAIAAELGRANRNLDDRLEAIRARRNPR